MKSFLKAFSLLLLFSLSVSASAQNCPELESPQYTFSKQQDRELSEEILHQRVKMLDTGLSDSEQILCAATAGQISSADELLSRVVRENWINEAWAASNLTTFEYTSEDQPAKIESFLWNESIQDWTPTQKITYAYGAEGLLRETIVMAWNGTEYVNTERRTNERNQDDRIIKTSTDAWINNSWVLENELNFTIEDSLLVEGSTTDFVNGTAVSTIRFLFEYDDQNREILRTVEVLDNSSQQWNLSGRQITEHTDSTVAITAQIYAGNDTWINALETLNIFDNRDNLIERIVITHLEEITLEDRELFTYETFGDIDRPTERLQQIRGNDDNWLTVQGDFRTYDTDGDLLRNLNQLYNEGANPEWTNRFQDLFTYGQTATATEDEWLQRYSFDLFPNPASGALKLDINLEFPATLKLSVYDVLGREVEILSENTFPTGPNQINWDVSSLPAGLYFVCIQHEHQVQTKPVMIVR